MTLDLEAIRARHAASTPGVWMVTTCLDYWIEHEQPIGDADKDFRGVAHCGDIHWPNYEERQAQWEANARFIAQAHQDIPALLARVEAGAAEIARLRGIEELYEAGRKQWNPVYKLVLDRADAAEAQVARLRAEIERLRARLTCMCGSWLDEHTGYEGHSPVSMYDYALDKEQEARQAAEAQAARLASALRPFAGMVEQIDRDHLQDGHSIPVLAGWCREAEAALTAAPVSPAEREALAPGIRALAATTEGT